MENWDIAGDSVQKVVSGYLSLPVTLLWREWFESGFTPTYFFPSSVLHVMRPKH